jgi:hypothetical protein
MISIAASSVASIAGTLAGHPLDTIRIRMMTSSQKVNSF